ncbi:MAG: hypothetical protein GX282_01545 [Campylobacteraceae bacterium]|nr:hypothetical protein [Campylobacteraceae bacterium]
MRYLLTIFIFSLSLLWGSLLPSYESRLESVADGHGVIADSPNIIVGSSGVVVHTFSNGESSIIARAVVTEKNAGRATVRFEVFGALSQPALPIPGVLPKSGDKVILNYLYDRALIVVPNEDIYRQIVSSFPNIEFVNPDIAGAYLSSRSKPNPNRDDFREICALNAAGLIFIAMDGVAVFADCGSFDILRKFETNPVENYQVPFYSGIFGISPAWWKWDSAYITNYDRHYKFLLDIKD